MDVELSTPRLRLRRQIEADIPAIMAGLNDWEVARWLTVVPFPYSLQDADEWIARQVPATPGRAHFAIDDGSGLIGVVTLDSEFGYWLDRSAHGRGYMTEACTALLEWHFTTRPDDVVPSGYHVGNAASASVQHKLGFVETGKREMRFVRSQQREVEHVDSALTKTQFQTAKSARRSA